MSPVQVPDRGAGGQPPDEALARRVLGAFYRVYDILGPGYLEAVYANALAVELRLAGLHVDQEVPLEVRYRGVVVGLYRADQIVEHRLMLELKAAAALHEAHRSQLVNALKAARLQSGLLLNFGPRPRFWRAIGLATDRGGDRP